MNFFSRSGRRERSRRRSAEDSDDDKESSSLARLRQEYEDHKLKLREEEEEFERLKERTGSKKSRTMLRLDDARERLKDLQEQYDKQSEDVAQKKKVLRKNKEKNDHMLRQLEENTREFTHQYNEKRDELKQLEEENRNMKDELAAERQRLEKEQQKLDELNREIESVRIRDQSVFFPFWQSSSRRRLGDEDERTELLKTVAESCKEVRDLVIKRYQLRESVRGKQNEIIEAKQKIQDVMRKIDSVRDHENQIVRMSSDILRGLENSTAENISYGTRSRHKDGRKETYADLLRTSNDHLEVMIREVPDAFQSLEVQAAHGSSSVNPKYRSLLTSLLQKIGLLMIQHNHLRLRLEGQPVLDYKEQLRELHTKNLKLNKELEELHEHRAYELQRMQEEIPFLEKDRDRLRNSRDEIVSQFEKFKKKRVDLEDTIREQRRKIKEKEKVCQEHDELRDRVEDLKIQLEDKLQKMRGSDRSVHDLTSLVYANMKRAGLAPLENPDDEESDPDESG